MGLVVLLVGVLLFNSCEYSTAPTEDGLSIPWSNQQTLVCFGTSLTAGYIGRGWITPPFTGIIDASWQKRKIFERPTALEQTSTDSISYPALLGKVLRIKVLNEGIIGATCERALTVVDDSVFKKNPALVLLEFGANDFLQGIDSKSTEQGLTKLIDTLHSFGSKVVLISFLYPEMINSVAPSHPFYSRKDSARVYLDMLSRVGYSRADLFLEYAMQGIYWNSELMSSDGLHPNRAGYRLMEANIEAALSATFRKNNMYK